MRKKSFAKISMLVAMICALESMVIMASDDNVKFSADVKSYQSNTRTNGRYRQTKYVENPWKVKLETSTEGDGDITTFWLELFGGRNVSADVYAVQGGPTYYNNPYDSANQGDVYLTMENNNYNGTTYSVTGYWDEETWD